jgi:LysM repeat protein
MTLFCWLAAVCLLVQPNAAYSSAGDPSQPVHDDYPLPETFSLCGEAFPLEDRHVWEMLDREFTISVWDRAQVFMWLKRAGRYFPLLEEKLAEAGMPQDLKYLALAESSLIGYVNSRAGAKGYWQFMAHTARDSGLRKDLLVDERLSFEHSTQAALEYLKRLKVMFGSWTLAMAAYNCGESRLKKEISEQRVKDYYRLDLPIETERYIYRIAAIKIIMEDPARYGYRIPSERVYQPLRSDTVEVNNRHQVHLADLAQALDTDFKSLKEMNPQILGRHLPTGPFLLKVPQGMGEKFPAVLTRLVSPGKPHADVPHSARTDESYYIVKPGDTLNRIAVKTGISVSNLKRYNEIDGSLIKTGQKLQLHP